MRFIWLIVFFATCVWARRPFLRPSGDEAEIETDVKEKVAENLRNNLAENEDEQTDDAINSTFQFREEEINPSLLGTTTRYAPRLDYRLLLFKW